MVISIVLSLCVGCYFIGNMAFEISTQLVNNEDTSSDYIEFLDEYGINKEEFEKKYSMETVEIKSSLDGHIIPASYFLAHEDKNNDTVVLVHGLGGNRFSVYQIAEIYLELGYNVIAYDQRSSGENTAQYTTAGFWESYDLLDYVKYLDNIIDNDKNIGVWGESFGGATVAFALGDEYANKRLAFAILDCPLSEFRYMMETSINEEEGNPVELIMTLGSLFTKVKLGFSYDDLEGTKAIAKTTVPVLIINSKADETTPYFMGEALYNAIEGENKKIYTVEDSKHVEIILDHKDEYIKEIKGMLP